MRTELEAHPTVEHLQSVIKELDEELSEIVLDYESRLVEANTLNKSLVKRIEELEGYFEKILKLKGKSYPDIYNPFRDVFKDPDRCYCLKEYEVKDIAKRALKG